MERLKMKNYMKGIAVLILMSITLIGYSQTANDAAELFNTGIQLINDDPEGALAKFEECVKICDEVGPDAEGTKAMAEAQIPKCYFKIAYKLYKDKKIKESIDAFIKTSEISATYLDNSTKKKADDYIPKLYNYLGNIAYKGDDFDGALSNFAKATELDPTYAKAYYGQALAYSKKEDNANALVACDKAIETALQTNDLKTAESAEKIAHNICVFEGNNLKEAGDYEQAINKLNKAIEYDSKSSQAYYLLSGCFNKLGDYEKAISSATKAIEFENGDDEKKASIYYELGSANKSLGETTAACSAFKNALYGAYTESAKYQIEVILKCQ